MGRLTKFQKYSKKIKTRFFCIARLLKVWSGKQKYGLLRLSHQYEKDRIIASQCMRLCCKCNKWVLQFPTILDDDLLNCRWRVHANDFPLQLHYACFAVLATSSTKTRKLMLRDQIPLGKRTSFSLFSEVSN